MLPVLLCTDARVHVHARVCSSQRGRVQAIKNIRVQAIKNFVYKRYGDRLTAQRRQPLVRLLHTPTAQRHPRDILFATPNGRAPPAARSQTHLTANRYGTRRKAPRSGLFFSPGRADPASTGVFSTQFGSLKGPTYPFWTPKRPHLTSQKAPNCTHFDLPQSPKFLRPADLRGIQPPWALWANALRPSWPP